MVRCADRFVLPSALLVGLVMFSGYAPAGDGPRAKFGADRPVREPFVSANDGGSGVALLMELAHHMKDLQTAVGVDFVFFDGEEFIHDKNDDYFFGSRHFADDYRRNKPKFTYAAAVLLDMIGGK